MLFSLLPLLPFLAFVFINFEFRRKNHSILPTKSAGLMLFFSCMLSLFLVILQAPWNWKGILEFLGDLPAYAVAIFLIFQRAQILKWAIQLDKSPTIFEIRNIRIDEMGADAPETIHYSYGVNEDISGYAISSSKLRESTEVVALPDHPKIHRLIKAS